MSEPRAPLLARIPVRVRLALAFAIVMAVVLGATGLFLHVRLADGLDETLDNELRARLAAAAAVAGDDREELGVPGEDPLEGDDEDAYVQVLGAGGEVVAASAPAVAGRPLVGASRVAELRADPEASFDTEVGAVDEELRVGAAATDDDEDAATVLVGLSLEERDEALAELRGLLLLGGPVALVLATLAGYGVARGALRPVDQMRRRAAEISTGEALGRRLPVPASRDEIAGLGTTLNAMLDRIERAFERERAFTADASHELRTPLSVLKAELDLALMGERSPAELEAALASASEETDRLVRLAEDLLILARADEGRLPMKSEPVAVAELARRVAGRFAPRAEGAGRRLAVSAPDPELRIDADPLRLEQAVSNLLDNALRYGSGEVGLRVEAAGGAVELHVTDAGEGFAAGLDGRAFDRFVRADHGGARGGSGLGLSIVAAIARAHGGSAHARAADGGGADVWLSLPRGDAG